MTTIHLRLGFLLGALLLVGPLHAALEPQELRAMLEKIQQNETWGEAVLEGGKIRPIKVQELGQDSVAVREVFGPFHERNKIYALTEFQSLRELGEFRIPLRRAPYREPKSMTVAIALEAIIPGGGYLYVGEAKQGMILLALGGIATTTALITKKDGAAGWVPISAWIKLASLTHLVDEVKAQNRRGGNLTLGLLPGEVRPLPALSMQYRF